jgi:hypothetical protein
VEPAGLRHLDLVHLRGYYFKDTSTASLWNASNSVSSCKQA